MKVASKEALRQEIAQLRRVGQMMSNACYNLAQSEDRLPNEADRRSFDEMRRAWDAISRSEKR